MYEVVDDLEVEAATEPEIPERIFSVILRRLDLVTKYVRRIEMSKSNQSNNLNEKIKSIWNLHAIIFKFLKFKNDRVQSKLNIFLSYLKHGPIHP